VFLHPPILYNINEPEDVQRYIDTRDEVQSQVEDGWSSLFESDILEQFFCLNIPKKVESLYKLVGLNPSEDEGILLTSLEKPDCRTCVKNS
jgi:hypothetical protein